VTLAESNMHWRGLLFGVLGIRLQLTAYYIGCVVVVEVAAVAMVQWRWWWLWWR
jgi:hypothetical protein